MGASECYGKNVYIDDALVGYVERLEGGDGCIYISGKRFARLTYEGEILIQGREVGYIDEVGDVYLNDSLVGELTPQNDIRFYGSKLKA